MKLGEIQLKWITELEEHPERQMTGYLGNIGKHSKTNEVVCKLCCLGQAVVVLEGINVNTYEGKIFSGGSKGELSEKHIEVLGLRSCNGRLNQEVLPDNHIFKSKKYYDSLIKINDNYCSEESDELPWVLIAKTMREYPEWAFKESK